MMRFAIGVLGDGDAGREDCFGCVGNRRIGELSVRRRKNPTGADFDHNELHDDLQRAGGSVPIQLCCSRDASDRRGNGNQQRKYKHVVRAQLLQPAIGVSDDLRAGIAFTVIAPLSGGQRWTR